MNLKLRDEVHSEGNTMCLQDVYLCIASNPASILVAICANILHNVLGSVLNLPLLHGAKKRKVAV